jgi:Arabinose-binding domain of AraC transcription regulator, N-term
VRLWHAVASHVPDPTLGLRLGTAVRAREFGLVGYTMALSPTVAAALQRLTRYDRPPGGGGAATLCRGAQ